MEMPRKEVDGQTEVTLDPDKFESIKQQESDYNNEDILLEALRCKAGDLVRDFDFEGILSVAFPCFSCNGAYDFSVPRKRKITIKEAI